MMICAGARAETYYWVGTAGDNDWATPENWNTADDGSGDAPDPALQNSDSVIIPAGNYVMAAYTPVQDITISTGAKLSITCDATLAPLTIAGTGILENSASIVITECTASDSSTITNTGSLFFKDCDADFSSLSSANFTNSGTIYFYNTTGTATTFKTPSGAALGTFHFWGNTNITLSGNCSASSFNMQVDPANHYVSSDFEATLNGSGNLTVTNDVTLTRASETSGKKGTFTVEADLTVGKTLYTHSGVIFQIKNGSTVAAKDYTHSATTPDVIAKTIIDGNLNVTETFDMALYAGGTEVTIDTHGKVTAKNVMSSQSTYDNQTSTVPFTNAGEITVSEGFDIPYAIPNTGIITADGASAVSAKSFSGSGSIVLKNATSTLTVTETSAQNKIEINNASATIKGSYTLTTFDASVNMGGKSITLDSANLEAGTIKLQGASAVSLLSLAGTAATDSFKPTSTLNAEFLAIDSKILLLNHTDSIDNCYPSAATPDDNDWLAIIRNGWAIKALKNFTFTWQGTTTAWNTASNWSTGIVPVTDTQIIIPDGCSEYPVLNAEYLGGTLSIAANASIKLGADALKLSGIDKDNTVAIANPLTNAGKIIYTDVGRIEKGGTAINDVNQGTVVYAVGGSEIITNSENGLEYFDIEILGSGWNLSGNYKIKNKLTTGTGTDGSTENCTVTGETTIQAKTFVFKGPVNFTADLTLAPYDDTNSFTVPSNLHEKVNTSNKKWLHLGTGSTPGNIIFSSPADFSYKLHLHSTATVSAEVQLRNSFTATQNIDGSGALVFTGTGEQIFTTNGKQFTVEIQETKDSGKLTIDGSPEITTFTTTTAAKGNIIFSNSTTIVNGFTQYDGTTTLKGTLSTTNNDVSIKALILSDNAVVNTGTGTQEYGSIDGTTGTEVLALEATTITLKGDVGSSKKLAKLVIDGATGLGADSSITADEFDFSGDISGSGQKLTLNTATLKSTKTSTPAAEISAAEIILAGDVTLSSSNGITLNTTKISESAEGKKLTNSNALSLPDEITIDPVVVNNGSLTCDGAATFNGAYSGSGNLILANADTTFANDVDLASCSDFTTGKVILTAAKKSPATLTGPQTFNNLTISGAANLAGDNTINGTLELTGTDAVSIQCNNTIATLTADGLGGKTITFTSGTTQNVTNMTLKGSSESSKLSLTSTGNWNISCAYAPALQWLSVENSTNSSSSTIFIASDSTDVGGNVAWNFPGQTYEWKAASADSNWNNAANWNPASIPGFGSKITINAASNYPKLSSITSSDTLDLSNSTYTAEITVATGATFDLANKSLVLGTASESGKITNTGTVILNGLLGQAISYAQMINDGDNSTVKYSAPLPANNTVNFVWDGDATAGKQYTNLIIENTVDAAAEDLIISKALTISKNISSLNSIFVGTTTTINSGCTAITTTGNQTYTEALTINETNGTELETTSGEISLVTVNGSSLTVTGNLNVAAGTTTTINTSGDQTYNCAIYGGGNLNLDSTANSGSGNITLNNDIDGTTLLASLGTKGDLTIDCENIKTSGTQSYDSEITISKATGTTLTGSNVTFKNDVSGTSLTVDGALKISGAVTVNTTGTQTYKTINGTTADTDTLTLTSTGLITLNGNVGSSTPLTQTYNGSLDLGSPDSIILKGYAVSFNAPVSDSDPATSLEVNAPATINCTGITTQGNQTYDKTVSLAVATTLTAQAVSPADNKNVTFKGNVTGTTATNTSLTINADTVVDSPAAEIKTNGVQSYNGNTTISSAASIESTGANITFASGKELKVNAATGITVPAGQFIYFNCTTSGSAKLTTKGEGTAKFTGNVTNLSALETLATQINCESITTSGNQEYKGAVSVITTATNGAALTSSAGSLSFTDSLSGTAAFTVSAPAEEKTISFSGNVGANGTPFPNLKISTARNTSFTNHAYIATFSDVAGSGNISFQDGGTITNNVSLVTNGTVSIAGTMNLADYSHTTSTGKTVLTGTMNASAVSFSKSEITGGTINSTTLSTGNLTVTNTATINTSTTQVYTGSVTINNSSNLYIKNATDCTFTGSVNGNKVQIDAAQNTNFNGSVELVEFTDKDTAGKISFNAGGSIAAAGGQTFLTSSLVTFGNGDDTFIIGSVAAPKALTHTAGDTAINGTLTAANITLETTSLTGTMQGAAITLGATSGGLMTIKNSGLLKTTDGSALTFTTSFTQHADSTGAVMLGGSFTGTAAVGTTPAASFAKNVYLYGTGTAGADFGATGNTITIATGANLVISRESTGALSVNADVTADNIALYKGAVTVNGNLTSRKDILVLGANYSSKSATINISDEYKYNSHRPADWSSPQYTLESDMPDNTTLPDGTASNKFGATLAGAVSSTITAGKNFYANGTTLSRTGGSGQWNLKLNDLTDPANGFAEAYLSSIAGCNLTTDAVSDALGPKAKLVTLECTDGGSNTNVDFDSFTIDEAYTVRDNAIYIKFNRPLRYHSTTLSKLKFNNAADAFSFTGFYSDPDCQTALPYDTQVTELYIKAASQDSSAYGAWNTDATGSSYGASAKSSDRSGVHHETKTCLDFPRALNDISFILTDRWGKRLTNYSTRSNGTSYVTVTDKTGPVLWTVRTGQELHDTYDTATGETSQHSYDAHNFLEFRYSEPVDIGSGASIITAYNPPADPSHTPNVVENIQVTDSLGVVTGNISSASSEITFAGLGRITGTSLLLHTGSNGSANKYMNALYRMDEYSIRLSIAGWTDGTVSDYAGNSYKKWPGYIEAASQFAGARAHIVDSSNNMFTLVKDQAGNSQTQYVANMVNPVILDNSSDSNPSDLLLSTAISPDLYSPWDLSSPVFTPLRFSKRTDWGNQDMSEAIGNTDGTGSTLDRIDFHFFDNTPEYDGSDEAEWYTEIGWCTPDSEASKDNLYKKALDFTYAADIIGGARQFDNNAARRTTGGIRFSTKTEIAPAFKYSTSQNDTSPSTAFKTDLASVHTTVVSQLFTGSSAPMHPANDPDGLYLGLGLSDTGLSVETAFAFSYSDANGYLTDLAGNRLRSKLSKTIDRTPPSFDVIISPIDTKAVYIIFVKQLVTESPNISFRDNSGDRIPINESFANLMPLCFRLISINSDGSISQDTENQIDTSVPAEIINKFSNDSFTCIKLTTKNDINIDNLKNLYVQLIMPQGYPIATLDPLTNNINSRVTFIQDQLGNYMSLYSAHSLSDFAVNYVNPLYAYASDMNDEEGPVMNNLYEEGSWAVHDWNANQQNYGTLPAGRATAIVADTKGDGKIRIYLSPSPVADSVSHQFNSDFKLKLRVWLPDLQDGIFRALSAVNNSNYVLTDGSLMDEGSQNPQNSIFNLSKEMISAWPSGSQISFMFGLMEDENTPVRIYNNPYYDVANDSFNLSLSIPVPLYCLRMTKADDISSLDLWSFKLRGITEQRGGVTILNNVINADKGENTVIKVNLAEDARLSVMVMTLDGNIITYLNRGETKAGEYYYTWNGKNKNGKSVARGMYFVRVTGGGIDETRKVMVVKD